ncbi:site-specific integrase [Dysgonomonas massiliensis]|uniref:site-specific integrase n=1 Tax=Dysgonomonas massiliensis TaxID=2040292 RepID=UPI000C7861AB|nr:site-specific integrase [Dysgonomonas massiliensis]
MEINRIVSTFIQKQYSNNDEYTIRISIRWKLPNEKKNQCVAINVGHTISSEKWDSELSRVKKSAKNKKYISYFEINKEIQRKEEVIDTAFKKFEFKRRVPSQKELRDTINHLLGKNVGKPRELITVQEAFSAYILDLSNMKTLSLSTYAKLKSIRNILSEFDSDLRLDEMTKSKLDDYIMYLVTNRGQQNTTVKKHMSIIRTFLKYCEDRRLIDTDWKTHRIELKVVSGKNVVFLDMNEFNRIYELEFPEDKRYLERTRDIFCFQCLTSLRYSDVSQLVKKDVSENYVNVVTEKTDQVLQIPLSQKALLILERYKDFDRVKALPVISNQKMNDYIKEICYLAEINQDITKTYFKGKERITKTFKKYDLICTHTARRTFICIALANGVTPETVMRITGHTDYKSMQPYIDVTDKAKIEAVSIFD